MKEGACSEFCATQVCRFSVSLLSSGSTMRLPQQHSKVFFLGK